MARKRSSVTEHGVPHERSKTLTAYKKKVGLPTWKEVSKDYEEGFVARVEKRIQLMERYAQAQRHLYETLAATGGQVANLLHSVVDMQGKVWELEEKLRSEGKNPLEDETYLKAREQLIKEMQFIHRHKLDIDKFQYQVEEKKQKLGDDAIFEVHVNNDE